MVLHIEGVEVDTGKPQGLKIPTTLLQADLGRIQAILSYDWLATNGFLVNGQRHGLCQITREGEVGGIIWVPGVRTKADGSGVSTGRSENAPKSQGSIGYAPNKAPHQG